MACNEVISEIYEILLSPSTISFPSSLRIAVIPGEGLSRIDLEWNVFDSSTGHKKISTFFQFNQSFSTLIHFYKFLSAFFQLL